MSVLVTGAAGFIGSHLTEALLARNESVVGLDDFCDVYPRSVKEANLASAREHEVVGTANTLGVAVASSSSVCDTASRVPFRESERGVRREPTHWSATSCGASWRDGQARGS